MYDVTKAEHLVRVEGNRLITDSRGVGRNFHKQHKNVLRVYDNLECSAEFGRLNFEPTEYIDSQGKVCRMVKMTKDGFMLLVMGFTGSIAMVYKEAYIAAFNEMAEYVTTHRQSLWDQKHSLIVKESDSKARATHGARLMLDRKREVSKFKQQHDELDQKIQLPLFVI